MSTQDITGKGRFTLLTGIGGIKWATAAKKASDALPGNVDIECYSIGYNFGQSQDYSKRNLPERNSLIEMTANELRYCFKSLLTLDIISL